MKSYSKVGVQGADVEVANEGQGGQGLALLLV